MKKYLIITALILFGFASGVSAQNYSFNNDLTVGSTGQDVINLQSWLISNGFDIPAVSSGTISKGYFGEQTRSAVASYQTSIGLPAYGYFGALTRGRINSNNYVRPVGTNPVINGINAPTTLAIGQTGTWNVRATDPQNSQLSYSVDWGDSNFPVALPNVGVASAPQFIQGTTFTHVYSMSGNYVVHFTVRNSAGLTAQTSSSVLVTGSVTASPLKIVSPNGGEILQKGTQYNITWASPYYIRATTADIKITKKTNCTSQICPMIAYAPQNIATGVPINQNSYNWNVGTVQPYTSVVSTGNYPVSSLPILADGDYMIQICETGTNNCASSDATFNITSASTNSLPDINIVSPNGGEVIQPSSTQIVNVNISGDQTKIGNAIAFYLVDYSNKQTYIYKYYQSSALTVGTKSIAVPIPYTVTPGSYRLMVTLLKQSPALPCTYVPGDVASSQCDPATVQQAYDYSDGYITVASAAVSGVPDINIVSPNGNEYLQIGQNATISWKLSGPIKPEYRVLLRIKNSNNTVSGIIGVYDPTSNGSVIGWTVPSFVLAGDVEMSLIPGSDYKIRAELYDGVPDVGGMTANRPTVSAKLLAYDESDNYFCINQGYDLSQCPAGYSCAPISR